MNYNELTPAEVFRLICYGEIRIEDVREHPKFNLIKKLCERNGIYIEPIENIEEINNIDVMSVDDYKGIMAHSDFFAMYLHEKTRELMSEVIPVVKTTNNVNNSLTLTTDKLQYTTLSIPVEIILPTVTTYTEIHLFFSGSEGAELNTTNVKWESQLTIENNKSYEVVFTYVNDVIGWLAKSIIYS